ncbi:MAG TPA: hypothetical protein GXZ77_00540 [Papillibacter sp.]|nr:hypothetical protein [Papillibacter sp.]
MNRFSHSTAGDTPSLSGAPSSREHENRFTSNTSRTPAAENKKEQGGAGKTKRKREGEQSR